MGAAVLVLPVPRITVLQKPVKCSCNHLHFCSATFCTFILQQTYRFMKDVIFIARALHEKQMHKYACRRNPVLIAFISPVIYNRNGYFSEV